MFGLLAKKKDLIGVDIGSSSVKLVQLWQSKGAYRLLNVGIAPLPPEAIVDNSLMDTAAVADAVRNLVASLGIKTRGAACSISGNAVIIRKIVVPLMSEDELEEQIAWEAEQYIPFDINDVNVDFRILGPDAVDPQKMQVLLVASKKDVISDYANVLTEAGCDLVVMDVDVFAVQNAAELNGISLAADEVVAYINIGASVMNINVVKGEVSLFTRDVQLGGNQYTEELQKQLGVSLEEAEKIKMLASVSSERHVQDIVMRVNDSIAQEVRRSVDFYNSSAANDDRIARIVASGGCSKIFGLMDAVRERLSMAVDLLNPFAALEYSEKDFDAEYLQEIAPMMAVCVGLAIRRAGDK